MNLSHSASPLASNTGIGTVAAMSRIIIADYRQQHQKCEVASNGVMASPLSLTRNLDNDGRCIQSKYSQTESKIPGSLLVKDGIGTNQDEKESGQQTEILNLVRGILHVAATNGDEHDQTYENHNCKFISPMIRKSKASVDCSGLNTLSLDQDYVESQEGEDYEDMVEASTITPESSVHLMANQKKRVHFETQGPSVRYTISREDMTHEEKRSFWLQDEEFALIRLRDGYLSTLAEQQQRQMAAAAGQSSESTPPLSSVPVSSTHWICARGLELKMKLRFLRTQSNRLANLEKVLIEQERQWDEHWDEGRNRSPFCYDDEAIADVCSGISQDCLVHAQRVAANDRQEVEDFLQVEDEKAYHGGKTQ